MKMRRRAEYAYRGLTAHWFWSLSTLLACLMALVGGASWLTQSRHVMSEATGKRVRTGVDGLRMALEGLVRTGPGTPDSSLHAAMAEPGDVRQWTVAMVLPHAEQNDERAFKQYLIRHHPKVHFVPVFFSGRQDEGEALVARLRALQPDLIYSWGTPTTLAIAGRYDAAKRNEHIRDIPIVFAEVTDPVSVGLLPSLDAPGRNVTGVPHIAPLATQLALLNAYRPFERIGFIDNPLEPNSGVLLARLIQASAGMALDSADASAPRKFQVLTETLRPDKLGNIERKQIATAVSRLKTRGAQVLYVGASTLLAFTYRDVLTSAALQENLPTFCTTESILRQSNCLFGIFSNGGNVGQYAAYKADRILTGHQAPKDIPADPLQRFSILINMPIAQRLALLPPLRLLPVAEVVSRQGPEQVRGERASHAPPTLTR